MSPFVIFGKRRERKFVSLVVEEEEGQTQGEKVNGTN